MRWCYVTHQPSTLLAQLRATDFSVHRFIGSNYASGSIIILLYCINSGL